MPPNGSRRITDGAEQVSHDDVVTLRTASDRDDEGPRPDPERQEEQDERSQDRGPLERLHAERGRDRGTGEHSVADP